MGAIIVSLKDDAEVLSVLAERWKASEELQESSIALSSSIAKRASPYWLGRMNES